MMTLLDHGNKEAVMHQDMRQGQTLRTFHVEISLIGVPMMYLSPGCSVKVHRVAAALS